MHYLAILNSACWGLFFAVWIGGALYNAFAGPRITRRGSSGGTWSWLLMGIAVYYILQISPLQPWPANFLFFSLFFHLLGAVLLVASTLFALWARFVLGTMWSSFVVVKTDHHLRTEGPYRITRHPIYTGILGMILGSALSVGPWALFAPLVALAVFLGKMQREERLLQETFGQAYVKYISQVPQLIPGWKGWSHRPTDS